MSETEFSKEEKKQLKDLFDKLDKNKDGKIDFNELNDYFKEQKLSQSQKDQEKVFELIKNSNSIAFDFRDFVDYVSETDKKIKLVFKDLDLDHNGIIDKKEIKQGFENLGVVLTDKQLDKLLQHLDKNNSLQIDWNEWRDFFRFSPHDKLEEMLRHWRVESFVDYADSSIPKDYTKKEKDSGLWLRNLVAGGLAGAVSRTCTAPLDRVKIFLQVHGSGSIIGSIKNMIKEGGFSSLWRGNFINVLKITPESAIKFTAYEQIKILMGQEGHQLPLFQKFYSGALAGFIAQSTIYPMEVLKTRLALRKTGQYNSIVDCIQKIYKHEGIKAFYRGYLMNTIGIFGVGIDLATYETLKNYYKNTYPNSNQPSTAAVLVIANTSSTVAMFSTYPIFLVRTRMQSSMNPKETILSISKHVYRKDGFTGFYRGAFANLTKVAPSASIGYLTYEYITRLIGVKKD